MAHDVFISYSALDKTIADAVCATLESRKIRCWIAPRDVLPGTPYAAALVDAISQSRILILLLSANSNTSQQVMREVERAVSKGIVIIPFRIADVQLSKALEYLISAPHWLDALTPPLEKHLNKLAATVQIILGAETKEKSPVETVERKFSASPEPLRKKAWMPPVVLSITLLVVFVAAGALLLGRQFQSMSPSVAPLTLTPGPGLGAATFSTFGERSPTSIAGARTTVPPSTLLAPSVPPGQTSASRLTPLPTQAAYFFDDFQGDTGGQLYNKTRWSINSTLAPGNYAVLQEDGHMQVKFNNVDQGGWVILAPRPYQQVLLNKVGVYQARMMISSLFSGNRHAEISLIVSANTSEGLRRRVGYLLGTGLGQQARIVGGITVEVVKGSEDWDPMLYDAAIAYDEWHTYRIEANAETTEFIFFVDGVNRGSVKSPDPIWKSDKTQVTVMMQTWTDTGMSGFFLIDDFFVSGDRTTIPPTPSR